MKVQYIDKNEIKPYKNNTKIHTKEQIEQIKKSIEQFGFNDPIALWGENEIVEGHGRYLAALKIQSLKEVPVIRLDELSDEQRKLYMIIHNKLTMDTSFNFEILEKQLQMIKDIDMSIYGFMTEEEIDEQLQDFFEPEEITMESRLRIVVENPTKEERDLIIDYLKENEIEYKEQ